MRFLIVIVSLIALALGCAIFAAGPGVRFGLWEWPMAAKIFNLAAAPKEIAGGVSLSPVFTSAGASLICAVLAFFLRLRGLALLALIGAAAAVAGGYIPVKMKALAAANPFIHDITTDFENPPQILAAAGAPRKNPAHYVGDEMVGDTGETVAAAQIEAFPDLTPLILKADMESATDRARAVIESMGMEVLAEGPAGEDSGAGWRIEAVATSAWFGFKDDFVVRLSDSGDGEIRIDVRSKSREGRSDLGANARRIQTFMEKMQA